jgi:hypothetical protein
MNSRHAAALALVGWYLILPRGYPNSTKHDVGAPLSQWYKFADFTSKEHCESTRAGLIEMLDHPVNLHSETIAKMRQIGPTGMSEIRQTVSDGKCIATADPRLKEK